MKKGLAVTFVFLSGTVAWTQDEIVGLRLREWYAEIQGEIFAQGGLIPAINVDLDRHLGLGKAELAHEIQAYVNIPILGRFYGGYWFTDYEGDRLLQEQIIFNDQVFDVATRVLSDLELSVYYLSYEFLFPLPLSFWEGAKAEIGLVGGARLVEARGSIQNEFVSGSQKGVGGLPVVGVHAALQVTPWLRGDIEVLGLTFSSGNRSASYFEAFAEVVAQPFGGLFGGVGYKRVGIDLEDTSAVTDFTADVSMDGVYVTAGIRF